MKANFSKFDKEIRFNSYDMFPLSKRDVFWLKHECHIKTEKDEKRANKILIKHGYRRLLER